MAEQISNEVASTPAAGWPDRVKRLVDTNQADILTRELGENYSGYHERLQQRMDALEPVPRVEELRRLGPAERMDALAQTLGPQQQLIRAEQALRRSKAAVEAGLRYEDVLEATTETSSPVLSATGQLMSLEGSGSSTGVPSGSDAPADRSSTPGPELSKVWPPKVP